MTAYYSLYSSIGLKKIKTIILIFVMMFGKLLDARAQSASPYCDFQIFSSLGLFGYDNALGNNFWITGLTTSGSGVVTPNNFSGGTSNAAMPSSGFDQGVYLSFGPTVTQTQAPTFTITRPAGNYACIFHVLVDWNNDNDLVDAGEEIITSGTIAANTSTFTTSAYTIPVNAPTGGNNTVGSHRMRIICEYQGETQRIPCGAGGGSGAQGNAKDFTLTVVAAIACSGNPPQLTVAPASVGVCIGASTTLNVTGIAVSGYTYQWQQSQTSGGPYTNATGASTNSSYTTPTTLPFNPTYYVCQVTCSNSALTTQSTESTVTLNSFLNCYCIGTYAAANAGTRGITQIILNGLPVINNLSAVNTTAPYYTLYTAASPVSNAGISAGTGYTLSVKVGSQAAAINNVGAWIDYNQDGVFSSTEFLGFFVNAALNSTTNINFTVPVTALSGLTALRVRHRYGAAVGATDACTNFTGAVGAGGAGETEDYRVNITSCTSPTVQASGNSMGSINTTDATINWTGNGNGDAVLVVLNQGSAPSGPAQATAYAGNSDFTLAPVVSGTTRAIYAGTGNSVNVTGLITNTTYFYSIYTYFTGTNCYTIVAPANGSFTTANGPMTTTAQTVTHPTTATITQGTTNNQILQVKIDCGPGTAPALVVSQLVFSTTALVGGTTNPADIANAKVFYTGTSSAFSSATQYGSTIVSPNGSFTVSGSTALVPGSNYFWLTYDIVAAPTINDFVDARLTSINIGSIISFISPVGDPAGNRQIVPLTYCTPSFTYCACSGCQQTYPFNTTAISFGTLNVSGLSCQAASWLLLPNTGSVTASQSYPLSVSRAQAGYAVSAIIYVDWNHNGTLNDPGELILNQSYGGSTTINVPSVTVPTGAIPGLTRMRVISLYDPVSINPCSPTSSFSIQGEARDFNITVIDACTAPAMNACPATIVVCSNTPATATWTNPTATGTSPAIVCSPASGSTFALGTTAVTCTATNGCGTSNCSFNVTVSQSPGISASASAPFCEGTQDLNLNATAPTGISYLWTGPGGYTSTNQNPVRTSTTASMSGTYSVKVTDANGCTNTTTTPVTVYALPPVAVVPQGSTHLCTGQSLGLIGDGAGSLTGTYVWSTSETGDNITVNAGGTYSVIGTDLHGCVNTDQVVISESAPPAAPVIVALGDVNLCSTDGGTNWTSVTLHTLNYTSSLAWNTSIDFGPDVNANYPSDYNVTYTDGLLCSSTSNTIILIPNYASTAPLDAQVSSDAPANITCAVPVTLTLAEADGTDLLADAYLGSGAHWAWYDDAGCGANLIDTGASIVVTPSAIPGPHNYYVRAEGICNNTNCATITITVKEPSLDPVSASASSPSICEGDPVVLSVSGGYLGTGASWKLYENTCSGAAIQTSSSPSFTVTPTSPGLHTYYIRGEGDCNNTICSMIQVDVKDLSSQAVSFTSTASVICEGDPLTLNINGGHLGTGGVWSIYEGGCGNGIPLQSSTSTSLAVTPQPGLHTYYVRAEGDCNSTLCMSVSVDVKDSSEMATSSQASPAVICEGDQTILSVSGGHLGTGASWMLYENTCGGAALQTSASPSFTLTPTAGLHTYYIRAEGDCNNTICSMIQVDVKDLSLQAVSFTSTASVICEGDPLTLNINGGHLGRGAVWSIYEGGCGNGIPLQSSTSTSLAITPQPGLHTYYVRAEGDCNSTLCMSVSVDVKDSSEMATSSQASPAVICEGDQTILSVSGGHLGTGASWMLYENTCGGAALQTSSSPSFTLTPTAGLHTYYIRAEGDCNNTICSMIQVDVKDLSLQAVALLSSASDICEGSSVTLNISGGHLGRGAVWSWYEGGCGNGAPLQSSTSTSLTLTPLTPGLHTYYVRAAGDCNTTLCMSVTVNVKVFSVAPASASASLSSLCSGDQTTLSVSGGSLGTGAQWKWYSGSCGGTLVGIGASVTVNTTATTTYFVRAEGDCNNTLCQSTTVLVNTSSTDPTTATSNAPVNGICIGGSVTLNVTNGSLGTGAVWKWYEDGCGNGAAIGTGATITITPSFEGLHSYYVRAEGPCNTTNCAAVSVLVGSYSVEATNITTSVAGNSICTGNNIILTVNGGFLGTVAQWKWYTGSCGGTLVATGGPSTTVNPAVTTTYYARAEGSCNTTTCVSITVLVSTSAPAQHANIIQSPQSICSGNQGTFTCQTVSNATYYSWSAPNGTTFNGNNPSPYVTTVPTVQVTFGPLPNGVNGYDICVFAGNGCGTSATKCKHVNGRTITPQIITGNASSCPNTSSVYSCSSSPGADTYLWTITGNATFTNGNDSIVTNGNSTTVNFGSGWTSGLLSVFAQMSCGYQSPAKTITIVSTPVVPGVMSGPALVCPSQTYNFSIAVVTGAVTYNWSTNVPGASIGAGTTSVNITFPAVIPAGSTVSVTATGSCGTSAPRVKNIATGLSNSPGTISGPAMGQCGQTGVGYSILPVAGATSYLWTASNGALISGLNNITSVSVNFPGLFTTSNVTVVAINSCGNSAPQTKLVTGGPGSPGAITGSGAVCLNDVETYSVIGSTGATQYTWTWPAGSQILSGQYSASIEVLYYDNTGGNLSVIASNVCGSSAPSNLAVSVVCRLAQISQGSLIDATLYPNPTVGTTTLKFETITAGDYKVSVVDMTGQVMQTKSVIAVAGLNLHELDLSTYAKGLYMVRLERKGEAMQMLRVTVE